MEINYGVQVLDRNGVPIGTVDHIVKDSWSGETRKFVVRGESTDLFFSPQDVQQVTDGFVKLDVTVGGQG